MSTVSIVYATTTVISLLLAVGYCCIMKKREVWLMLLYFSVFIVNCGYLCLSVSKTLGEALLANRIAYLGSAFLPLCMLMTIMNVCRAGFKKVATAIFLPISCAVFLIAATPGYTEWYYTANTTINITDGLTTLVKEYGPLHCVYLLYLVSYFLIMLCVIGYAIFKKRITGATHAAILASAVLGNIGVWGIEQLINIEFEFLSISYIVTELFLLMLYIMLQAQVCQKPLPQVPAESASNDMPEDDSLCGQDGSAENGTDGGAQQESVPSDGNTDQPTDCAEKAFADGLALLTVTERKIYDLYLAGKTTKETADALGIKENTLKFHNKNIYQKLGVSSRKQLLYYASLCE